MPIDMRSKALALGARGFPVFPLDPIKSRPMRKGFPEYASKAAAEIERMFTDALGGPTQDNIAILTGGDVIVVDVDAKDGPHAFESLNLLVNNGLPSDTFTVRTPSGGLHLFFKVNPDFCYRNKVEWRKGIDLRGWHGYVVAPGSSRPNGSEYVIEKDLPIAELPTLFADEIAEPHRRISDATAKVTADYEDDWSIGEAIRLLEASDATNWEHNCMVALAHRIYDLGVTPTTALALFEEHWPFSLDEGEDLEYQLGHIASSREAEGKQWGVDHIRRRPPVFSTFERLVLTARNAPRGEELQARPTRPLFGPDLARAVRTTRYEPLIEGLIDKKTFALILGEPKQGKTHVALSLFGAVAQGEPWGGRPTAQGLVCYFAGEGGDDVIRRALALTDGRPPSEFPFALFPARFNVVTPSGVDQVLKCVDEAAAISGFDPIAIVLDTLSRGFGGLNENESAAMGLFIEGVDKIRARSGANVTVLHHLGKNKENGARGHSALRGAYDTALMVADQRVSVIEQRALRPTAPAAFQIVTKLVGPDSEDHMVETAVAQVHATAFTEPVLLPSGPQRALEVFDGLVAESETGIVSGAAWNARLKEVGPPVTRGALSHWRAALVAAAQIEKVGADGWARL